MKDVYVFFARFKVEEGINYALTLRFSESNCPLSAVKVKQLQFSFSTNERTGMLVFITANHRPGNHKTDICISSRTLTLDISIMEPVLSTTQLTQDSVR